MKDMMAVVDGLSPPSQEAVRALIKQLCENEGINYPHAAAPGLQTLDEGLSYWNSHLIGQGYSPRSIKVYRFYIDKFLDAGIAPNALSVQQYLAEHLMSGISAAAVKNELKALKSFFSYLYAQGLWPNEPTRNLKPPKLPKREIKSPAAEDVAKVLSEVDNPKLKVLLVLFGDAGFRFGELVRLEWDRVDLQNHEVTVIGKGDKERTVPLSLISCIALQSIKELANGGNRVFPSTAVGGWDNSNVNKSLARICKKAGVKKFTCHQLRHFFATFSLQHGADLKTISEILGHSDPSTTVRFYAHTSKLRMKRQQETRSPFSLTSQQLLLPEANHSGGLDDAEGNETLE
jgi:site-specific recombinase XerD